MRKLFKLSLCVALVALCVTVVKAENYDVPVNDTSRANLGNWQVALIERQTDTGTKTADLTKADIMSENLFAKWNDETSYGKAKRITGTPTGWTSEGAGWISADTSGMGYSGLYAYMTTFTATAGDVLESLTMNAFSDDYIVGFAVNGVWLDFDVVESLNKNANVSDPLNSNFKGWLYEASYRANYDESKGDTLLKLQEENTLVVFVHNNNSENWANEKNWTGFNARFEGTATPAQSTTTPEPATLAILGLGVLGAAAARRRQVKKA